MKTTLKLIATIALLNLTGCGSVSEQESSLEISSFASHVDEKNHEDGFVFRDSNTNEILQTPNTHQNGIRQKFTYLTGSPITWGGKVIRWSYNSSGQPSQFSSQDVLNTLIAATQKWSAACNIQFEYVGTTSIAQNFSTCDRNSVVGWNALAGSSIGYAQACYMNGSFNEMDMTLDNEQPYQINNLNMLHMTAVHEFGHTLGLGHTDILNSIMTPWLSTNTLSQDDIDGCQSLYGKPISVIATPEPSPIVTPAPTPTPEPAPTLFCQPNETQSCLLNNGISQRTCNPSGQAYGSCRAISCNIGYTLQNNSCVQNAVTPVVTPTPLFCEPRKVQGCAVRNGTGARTCNSSGTRYSSCRAVSCQAGYKLLFGRCYAN